MFGEEKSFCQGVILGAYRFEYESKSEFKEWAEDVLIDCVGCLLGDWRKRNGGADVKREMDDFLIESCSKWEKYLVKSKTEQND